MRGCARTGHFGRFGPCLNTIPFWTVYILGVTCWAARATRHCLVPGYITSLPDTLQENITFPPFSLLCRCALSSFGLFTLRVPGVSASKRADTHPAPSLNADPSLSFRTHSRHSEAFQYAETWIQDTSRYVK